MSEERLPYGKQFSPKQVDLGVVLGLAKSHEGDRPAFEAALRASFFDGSAATLSNRETLAMNAFLAVRHYGLITGGSATDPYRLTEIGASLYDLRSQPTTMFEVFAQHIIVDLHGLQLLEVVESLVEPSR